MILFLTFTSITLFGFYELAICAIFQDEASYFKEWIEFHKLQGVQHFYLYNNNSQDNYLEVLKPYVLSGDVTLVEWPYTYDYKDHAEWIRIQGGAYMDCISRHKNEIEWLAVIDIDEFLFCPNGTPLPKFLGSYRNFGGVCVNWLRFGTSHVEEIPPEVCMIELLVCCSKQTDFDNLYFKSIVQPRIVSGCKSAHRFTYMHPFYGVLPDKTPIFRERSKINNIDEIRINHYWTRTKKHFFGQKIESSLKRRPTFTEEFLQSRAEDCNVCQDTAILQYVDGLRKAMDFTERSKGLFSNKLDDWTVQSRELSRGPIVQLITEQSLSIKQARSNHFKKRRDRCSG